MQEKVLLLILDGFGINRSDTGNAIAAARMPAYKKFLQTALQGELKTCGKDVGLPADTMGNSEVGHLNIGAGRIVYQLNTMIDSKIETGDFFSNPALLKAIIHCQKYNSNLHLCGLLSDGNVHSFNQHLYALLDFCDRNSMKRVYLHAFMDGRDTPPDSGLDFIKEYEEKAVQLGIGKIVSVSGRYYAMDRDKRWDRVELAYQAMVYGKGERFPQADLAVSSSYQ
ncbi:MAG: 2,3-bisphosphoglycerate-independent phosphoglycerate mutase, partial [Candidatus Cloacimonetes bacterium]|nr:2,3-bisphosphoglycerate-independent phosphoglycerate mutase [Candidatus Cloacimonadota bacterium]